MPGLRPEYIANVKASLSSFSQSALSSALRAWRRYVSFCAALPGDVPPLPANPATISVFLNYVGMGDKRTALSGTGGKRKMGGRNAAKPVRSGLKFIQDHIELGLAADDADVVISGLTYPATERGQAEVALISDLFSLTK